MAAVSTLKTPDPINPLDLARAEMMPGESLIWAETPLAKNARWRSIPISILGWLFLLLALAWVSKAAVQAFGLLLIGLPFVIASLVLAAAPWWWPIYMKRTVYAISDRRLLIIRDLLKRKVTSYGPADIDVVERRERRDGSGDVIFRREEIKKLKHHHDPYGKRRVGEREVGFFGVPDVRKVEEVILALKNRGHQADIERQNDDRAVTGNGSQDANVKSPPGSAVQGEK